jgi:nitronate monooxygenase
MIKAYRALQNSISFAQDYNLRIPIILSPMAGVCPVSLSVAVANSGGMGSCGTLLMSPEQISEWVKEMRKSSNGTFQLNTWIPDPKPIRNCKQEESIKNFLAKWEPRTSNSSEILPSQNFELQCEAMIEANPPIISSIMGLYPSQFISCMKDHDIKWFATATTVSEAIQAERAGANAIVAQGMEAGGHRGSFVADNASENMVGLFSLLPAVVDAVNIPVIAAGGIADGRGIAASLLLGASAVQMGTCFFRSPEAKIPKVWAEKLNNTFPEDTVTTRAFSGRLGRSLRTNYTIAANSINAPIPAPYPIQRHLTQNMRTHAIKKNTLDGMQAWAGQSARLALDISASEIVCKLWEDTRLILE